MTLLTCVIILIQLVFWHNVYGALLKITEEQSVNASLSATVVICAKDELSQLKQNLPYILKQSHPNYNIIIADDGSTDGSSLFLEKIDNENGILQHYEVSKNMPGKKQALREALSLADTDHILLTDADCMPESDSWVERMSHVMEAEGIEVVLGYGPQRRRSDWVSKWCHFETWLIAIQYLSYAKRGLPYMGVGRNMMYDKRALSEDVLHKYDHLASGDDDLTIMQIATAENTDITIHPASYMTSDAPADLKAYWHQKTRHYSTASSYKNIHKVLLGGYALSQILFHVCIIALACSGEIWMAMILYCLRWAGLSPQIWRLKNKLHAEFSSWAFPIYDLMQTMSYIVFSFAVLFPQKQRW